MSFARQVPGRTVKGRCVQQTARNRHKRSCKRSLVAGALTLGGHAGTDKVAFQGRLTRSRKLAPGSYTVTIVAADAAGRRSQARSLRFTIVSR
jgi:hypothetical protein